MAVGRRARPGEHHGPPGPRCDSGRTDGRSRAFSRTQLDGASRPSSSRPDGATLRPGDRPDAAGFPRAGRSDEGECRGTMTYDIGRLKSALAGLKIEDNP